MRKIIPEEPQEDESCPETKIDTSLRVVTLADMELFNARHSWHAVLESSGMLDSEETDEHPSTLMTLSDWYYVLNRSVTGSPTVDDNTGVTEIPEHFSVRGGQIGIIDIRLGEESWGILSAPVSFEKQEPPRRNCASAFCNGQRGVHCVTHIKNHPGISSNVIKAIYNQLHTPLDGQQATEDMLVENTLITTHAYIDRAIAYARQADHFLKTIFEQDLIKEFEEILYILKPFMGTTDYKQFEYELVTRHHGMQEAVYMLFDALLQLEKEQFVNVLEEPNPPLRPIYSINHDFFSLGLLFVYKEQLHAHLFGNSAVEIYDSDGNLESSSREEHDPLFDLTDFRSMHGTMIDAFSDATGIRPSDNHNVPNITPSGTNNQDSVRKVVIPKESETIFLQQYLQSGGNIVVETAQDTQHYPPFMRTRLTLPTHGMVVLSTPRLDEFLSPDEIRELVRACSEIKLKCNSGQTQSTISTVIHTFLTDAERRPRPLHHLKQDMAMTFMVF